jgi:hypothetical protein
MIFRGLHAQQPPRLSPLPLRIERGLLYGILVMSTEVTYADVFRGFSRKQTLLIYALMTYQLPMDHCSDLGGCNSHGVPSSSMPCVDCRLPTCGRRVDARSGLAATEYGTPTHQRPIWQTSSVDVTRCSSSSSITSPARYGHARLRWVTEC